MRRTQALSLSAGRDQSPALLRMKAAGTHAASRKLREDNLDSGLMGTGP